MWGLRTLCICTLETGLQDQRADIETPQIENGANTNNSIVQKEEETTHSQIHLHFGTAHTVKRVKLLHWDGMKFQTCCPTCSPTGSFNLDVQTADFSTSAEVFLDPLRKCTMPLAWVGSHATNIWSVGLLME